MFILSTIADTFVQTLKMERVRHDPAATTRIRAAMLELLPPQGGGGEIDRLRHRVLVAPDPTSLWFLRVSVHQHLTRSAGEQSAMQQVHALRPLFEKRVAPSLLGPLVKHRMATAANAMQALSR